MFYEIDQEEKKEVLCYSCSYMRLKENNHPGFIRCEAFAPESLLRENYEYIFGVIGPVRYFNWNPSLGDPIYNCEKYENLDLEIQ